MRLFVSLTRWTDYFGGLLAIQDVEERSASLIMEKAKALALLRAGGGGGRDDKVTYAKAEASLDADVAKYEAEYETAHAKRRFAAVHFEASERDSAVVSRELTRRIGRQETNDRRVARWTP